MADITFKSPGVGLTEIDLTVSTAVQPVGIPAGIIGASLKGPAFVPLTLPTMNDFVVVFGAPNNNTRNGPLAANEWLKNSQALTFLKVLGAGQGLTRETSSPNAGKVLDAGFVVGDQQPQSTLSGALGNNSGANAVSATPNATGSLGRTYLLGCFMSESSGASLFSGAGIQSSNTAVPVLRGMIMAASGVVPRLSSSFGGNNDAPPTNRAADELVGTITGSLVGAVNLGSGRQEFVLLLNGWKASNPSYPNVITASFDMTAANYFGKILNKDPLKLEDAGYVLYSQFDIHSNIATITGSGVVVNASGSAASAGNRERCAFILTSSLSRNLGSTTVPNYENFENRYTNAKSPYIVSQKFGGNPANLFQVQLLDDGEYPNDKVKISIENISPSLTDATQYGTFDLLVRDFNDVDGNKVVLEAWRGLSLDTSSPRYIAKVIGDYKTFFNWDAAVGSQKLITEGQYQNQSKYIRIKMADAVEAGEVDATALPMGFRGVQHLITSGTAPMVAYTDAQTFQAANPFYKLVQPPIPTRLNLTKGVSPRDSVDSTLYWGIQFENQISATEPNATTVQNDSIKSFTKYYPNFHTSYMNVVVSENEGTADTAENGILDADRFNNNLFTLEKVRIKYNSTSLLADSTTVVSWSYFRQGNITTDTTNRLRAMTVNDLRDPTVRTFAKFTMPVQGGFDGVRIFNNDTKYLTNNAVVQEMNNSNRGLSNGATVKSYVNALGIMNDTSEVDIQVLSIPGIRQRYITDTALQTVQNRFDAVYVMDIEERDVDNLVVSTTSQNISVRNTVSDFRGRGLNNSFGASYFPDVFVRDNFSRTIVRVPPSVAVLGAISYNDAVAYPWFAPAGFARGALSSTTQTAIQLSKGNMDDLQSVSINPITAFPDSPGVVVWGQKTLYALQSALDRVNVRRLLISIRREVRQVANRIAFEPNRASTLERFSNLVNPILKRAQDQNGIDRYLVRIDTSTTTEADVLNKTIKGQIFIQPTRTLERLSLDFILSNNAANISG